LFSGVSGFAKISSTLSQLIAFSNPNILSPLFGVSPVYYTAPTFVKLPAQPAPAKVYVF
jgi:hypothetical protein